MCHKLTSRSRSLNYNFKTKKEQKKKTIIFEFELIDERIKKNIKRLEIKHHNCCSPLVYLYWHWNLIIAVEVTGSPHDQHQKET